MKDYILILRPSQWLKNLMLLFPPFLGGAFSLQNILTSGPLPIFSFCLASSATYVFNDIIDATTDRLHPSKKLRPIPANRITKLNALIYGMLLLLAALVVASTVSKKFVIIVVFYVFLSSLYTLRLKQVAILDLFCISSGFLLRLFAGGEAFSITISDWLFLSVFLLAIFLSAGKRYAEIVFLGDEASSHRISLSSYSTGLLDGIMYMTGSAVLVTYTMYVIDKPSLIYTVPLCTFGLFRYVLRVKSGQSGDPTESLIKDVPLFVTSLIWACWVGWSIY